MGELQERVPGPKNKPSAPKQDEAAKDAAQELRQRVLQEELNILIMAIEKGSQMGCYNPIELKAINSSVEVLSEQIIN